jgi:hypothetical protein
MIAKAERMRVFLVFNYSELDGKCSSPQGKDLLEVVPLDLLRNLLQGDSDLICVYVGDCN